MISPFEIYPFFIHWCYIVQVSPNDIESKIPPSFVKRPEHKCKLLIINCSNEGGWFYSAEKIKPFLNECRKTHDCEAIFLTMNEKICDDKDIFYINFAWDLYNEEDFKKLDLSNTKTHKFTYLGGYCRPEKVEVLLKLQKQNMLKDALWSFGSIDWLLDWYKNTGRFKVVEPVLHLLPKTIDIDFDAKITEPYNASWSNINYDLYDSRFSLIQETETSSLTNRYTEKTFKCLLIGHPFIVCGNYQSLKLLKKDGFKTFHPFIDESYDEIINDDERINFAINESKKLCNMNDEEWKNFLAEIEPIIKHNHNNAKKHKDKTSNLLENIIKRYE